MSRTDTTRAKLEMLHSRLMTDAVDFESCYEVLMLPMLPMSPVLSCYLYAQSLTSSLRRSVQARLLGQEFRYLGKNGRSVKNLAVICNHDE